MGVEGASQTVFGSQGSRSFITWLTAVITGLFFMTSIGLQWLSPKETTDELALFATSHPEKPSIVASQ